MFFVLINRMNIKMFVIFIFVVVLVIIIFLVSGGLEEDMFYKSFFCELWRKESDMKEIFDEVIWERFFGYLL